MMLTTVKHSKIGLETSSYTISYHNINIVIVLKLLIYVGLMAAHLCMILGH